MNLEILLKTYGNIVCEEMALKVLESFFSFPTIRRKKKIGERKCGSDTQQDSKTDKETGAKSETNVTNVSNSNIWSTKSFSSLSAGSSKGYLKF